MRLLLRQFLLAAVTLLGTSQFALAASQYGQTTRTVVVNGKTRPPGSYVQVIYDGGDSWINSEYVNADRIPKAALTIISNVSFTPRPRGAVTRQTQVYKAYPNVSVDPTTIEQRERVAPLEKGTEVTIISRQGDDYIVYVDKLGSVRLPISVVTITSGSVESGKIEPIPPLPSAGLKPIYSPTPYPPQPAEESNNSFGILINIFTFAAGTFVLAGIWFKYKQARHKRELADAVSPVPHVDFKRNDDGGFTVKYKRGIMGKTEIQVTPDFVIIDGEKHNRDTFRNFTREGQGLSGIKLGYFIGTRSFPIESSAWGNPQKFDEFLLALNIALQRAPRRSDGSQVSADDLRRVRPTKF